MTTPSSGGNAVAPSRETTTLSTGGVSGLSNGDKIFPPNGDLANGETVVQFMGGKSSPSKYWDKSPERRKVPKFPLSANRHQ